MPLGRSIRYTAPPTARELAELQEVRDAEDRWLQERQREADEKDAQLQRHESQHKLVSSSQAGSWYYSIRCRTPSPNGQSPVAQHNDHTVTDPTIPLDEVKRNPPDQDQDLLAYQNALSGETQRLLRSIPKPSSKVTSYFGAARPQTQQTWAGDANYYPKLSAREEFFEGEENRTVLNTGDTFSQYSWEGQNTGFEWHGKHISSSRHRMPINPYDLFTSSGTLDTLSETDTETFPDLFF